MRIDFVTLFPEMIGPVLGSSIIGRAQASGLVRIGSVNPRDFCYDRHLKVDDGPYGGEPGMLIRAEPVDLAVRSLSPSPSAEIILTAPSGVPYTQAAARELSEKEHLIFLCGHYEGFDHRVETVIATRVYSIGDFVLTNGELPALAMADSVIRLIPRVLGDEASLAADSHAGGLLSAPNYTRPENWKGHLVPDVLRSGDHVAIRRWRRAESLRITAAIRPDLLSQAPLDEKDVALMRQNEDPDEADE